MFFWFIYSLIPSSLCIYPIYKIISLPRFFLRILQSFAIYSVISCKSGANSIKMSTRRTLNLAVQTPKVEKHPLMKSTPFQLFTLYFIYCKLLLNLSILRVSIASSLVEFISATSLLYPFNSLLFADFNINCMIFVSSFCCCKFTSESNILCKWFEHTFVGRWCSVVTKSSWISMRHPLADRFARL